MVGGVEGVDDDSIPTLEEMANGNLFGPDDAKGRLPWVEQFLRRVEERDPLSRVNEWRARKK